VATQFRFEQLQTEGIGGSSFDDATFTALNARFIAISSEDEAEIAFFRPGGGEAFEFGHNRQPDMTISLPIAVPLASVEIFCENEVLPCHVGVSVIGT
jgi:hypothetical protein